jgi:hypothetical protein
MIRPEPEQFRPPAALYRAVAAARVKLKGDAGPRLIAPGVLCEVPGYPPAQLAPLNGEAVYAKAHSIRRQVRQEGWLVDARLIAVSLGAAAELSQVDATAFVQAWIRNPKPVAP